MLKIHRESVLLNIWIIICLPAMTCCLGYDKRKSNNMYMRGDDESEQFHNRIAIRSSVSTQDSNRDMFTPKLWDSNWDMEVDVRSIVPEKILYTKDRYRRWRNRTKTTSQAPPTTTMDSFMHYLNVYQKELMEDMRNRERQEATKDKGYVWTTTTTLSPGTVRCTKYQNGQDVEYFCYNAQICCHPGQDCCRKSGRHVNLDEWWWLLLGPVLAFVMLFLIIRGTMKSRKRRRELEQMQREAAAVILSMAPRNEAVDNYAAQQPQGFQNIPVVAHQYNTSVQVNYPSQLGDESFYRDNVESDIHWRGRGGPDAAYGETAAPPSYTEAVYHGFGVPTVTPTKTQTSGMDGYGHKGFSRDLCSDPSTYYAPSAPP